MRTEPTTYSTTTVQVAGIVMVVPTSVPTDDRADALRRLWDEHVVDLGDWKGKVAAVVPAELADDVAEAMEFMGAIIDVRRPAVAFEGQFPAFVLGLGADGRSVEIAQAAGTVLLWSRGYRAHGF